MYAKAKELRSLADTSQAAFDEDPDNESLQLDLKKHRVEAETAEKIVESYLRQKSRCTWLREGGMNSNFFIYP